MIKTLAAAALLTVASVGFAVAGPTDFYATPMNAGAPTNLPGETIIPGMTQGMQVLNAVTQPILQPILSPGAMAQPAPMAEEPMMRHHRMHHRMMHHHMMHHRMMQNHETMQ